MQTTDLKGPKGGNYYMTLELDRVEAGTYSDEGFKRDLYSFHKLNGNWSTGSSTCLPSDINLAIEYNWLLSELLHKAAIETIHLA